MTLLSSSCKILPGQIVLFKGELVYGGQSKSNYSFVVFRVTKKNKFNRHHI